MPKYLVAYTWKGNGGFLEVDRLEVSSDKPVTASSAADLDEWLHANSPVHKREMRVLSVTKLPLESAGHD